MNQAIEDSFQTLFSNYHPTTAYDEFGSEQQIRPHWHSFIRQLEQIPPSELRHRWESVQRQLTAGDISFPSPDAPPIRPWTPNGLPLIIPESQWQILADGVQQRVQLLELILQDLFGKQTLIASRLLPPEALHRHPSFFPAFNTFGNQRSFIQLYAADLTRTNNGDFLVTGDRTRSPFGLGYLLENRIMTTRCLPQVFRNCGVKRLAEFFKSLQDTLREMAPRYRDNPRIAIWTKGPESASYIEDAYLARYLGYTLVEADDMAVRDNRVMIKTLTGLLPIEVLFRRLDDEACDPVELDANSQLGVSGLVEVMRSHNVAMANALGSRLVESPIFMPFLDDIARERLGEPMKLGTAESWWCGMRTHCSHVLANLDHLIVRPAFRAPDDHGILPRELSREQKAKLREQILDKPWKYAAQEIVPRSSSPVWINDRLEPWSLGLRAFVASHGKSYVTLPSALARLSPDFMTLERTISPGERSPDLWVLSERKVPEVSLLPALEATNSLRRAGDDLPSRVADNFYWLGRNLERAEGQTRLLRCTLARLTEEREQIPELPWLVRGLVELGQMEPDYLIEGLRDQLPDVTKQLPTAMYDPRPMGLRDTVGYSLRTASKVRDRLAIDMWRAISELGQTFDRQAANFSPDATESIAILDLILSRLLTLSGLIAESMTRTHSWRFIELGKRIERAMQSCALTSAMLSTKHADEAVTLDAALATLDSSMTYRSRYLANIQALQVVDLVVLDETNPRSIAFQILQIAEHVERLPRDSREAVRSAEQKHALTLQYLVRIAEAKDLVHVDATGNRDRLQRLLERMQDSLAKLSESISGRFLIHAGLQRHYGSSEGAR